MIFALFHVLYIVGKFLYENYSKSNKTTPTIMSEETEYQQISEASRTMIDAEAEQTYESSIKFNPPAYIQRYLAVLDIIQDPIYQGQIRKV